MGKSGYIILKTSGYRAKGVGKLLIGQFEYTVDAKGRVNIPAKLKDDLGEKFVVTRGLDNCVALYPLSEWKIWEEKLKAQPESKARNLKRFFFAGASEAEPDKQGRIVIPPLLRQYAGLNKDVVIIGASDRAEIWDKERWYTSDAQLTSDAMAQEMDSLNF